MRKYPSNANTTLKKPTKYVSRKLFVKQKLKLDEINVKAGALFPLGVPIQCEHQKHLLD